jgi:Tfp pilus assembly protein PilF
MSLGRHTDALASLERALSLQPRHAALLANRGRALRALGRDVEALASYDAALAVAPADASLHHSRGVLLLDLQCHQEALASFDRALAINASSAEVLNNRGVALGYLARPREALEAFDRAVACRPDYPEAYINRANTRKGLGRFQEALGDLDRALASAPDYLPALWSKGLLQLSLGEYAEGWPLYEARLRLPELRAYRRDLALPRWHGSEPLEDKSILVHAEQGLGDALQFSRYLPLLESRARHVFFEVPATLVTLMRSLPIRGTLIVAGESLPQADYHCPLLSLPLAFGTDAQTIPGGVPYLKADAAAVAGWRQRLRALPGLKVGVNWQGHVGTENQPWIRGRSFALNHLAPLACVPGVSLVSLQKGAAAAERLAVEFAAALAPLTDPLDTGPEALMETAALMCALDLVITSDTSVAHLAGALGVPVWVVLQAVPDWRWLLERSDSPWYPSARLFRQREAGNWPEVFGRVTQELAALAPRG